MLSRLLSHSRITLFFFCSGCPPLVTAPDPCCHSPSISEWISSSPFILYLALHFPSFPQSVCSLGQPNIKTLILKHTFRLILQKSLFNSLCSLPFQVVQVVNADALVVKLNSGEYKTIHLSSIRPPRNEGEVGADLCLALHTVGELLGGRAGGLT